ncbi:MULTISPECIES: hypoxanthine-guanine phosphoribosyltransferase [unclassified Guyparkeria]|uniref:hypoxanthine-guanine phosphoribosyltransferase n=1 Tax=unclassified Guyparkeria TaxID=2626246 RepID=UPI0007335DBE|nr:MULTISPECIES: hypoxanthine-guanine phosphoribosyltransferase [unclassified Guyparkeria]KTG17280.1 hypoxanthine-guanine phosphoribosyltransferase [Guyparkeria sp. XI15]OAE87257.1 hypoxanthine-guanine phosphoribosyltransferase [Guyparkeria sp. WRN-7]
MQETLDWRQRSDDLDALLARCDCLIAPEEMQATYSRLAEAINARLAGRLPVVLALMNGGLVSAGQILPQLTFPLELSYLHATRYRGATTGGALKWLAQPDIELAGREVLLVDDILDEGHTLAAVREWCLDAGASRVWIAVATDKRHERKVAGLKADFCGVTVPDRYIFGEGMDYHGYFRNLPGIYALPDGE